MDEASGMGVLQGKQNLLHIVERFYDRNELAREPIAKRSALDKLHFDEHRSIEHIGRKDLDHVVMTAEAHRLGLNDGPMLRWILDDNNLQRRQLLEIPIQNLEDLT